MRPATGLVRDRESTHEVEEIARWLAHRDEVGHAQIEAWMIRRESLATDELAQLWADRAWADALSGLLIETIDGHDAAAGSEHEVVRGFLSGVSAGRGVAVLGIDGTTRWIPRRRWTIVHPVLLSEPDAWRAAAQEFGVRPGVPQLHRAWTVRDPSLHRDSETTAMLGGNPDATTPVHRELPLWESGAWITAKLTIAAESTVLSFVDTGGRALRLAAVGPIAWSEAVRAARLIDLHRPPISG
jgi:hypothetical protein